MAPGPIPDRRYASVDLALATLTLGVASCSVLGFAGAVSWQADLFSHFRPQYAVLLGLTLVLHAWRRQPVLVAMAGALLAVNVALIAPLYLTPVGAAREGDPTLSVVQWNVLRGNPEIAPGIAYLRASAADVIVLEEFDPRWADAMSRSLPGYDVVLSEPRTTNFGIAMYLRRGAGLTLRGARLLQIDDEGWRHPALEAEFVWNGAPLAILAVHAHPPLNRRVAWIQATELERVALWSKAQSAPHLVVGDLNMTPWSALYRRLVDDTGLSSARDGFGVVATLHPWAGLVGGLPVDHVFISDAFEVTAFSAGPALGSDHRPVRATLRAAAGSGAASKDDVSAPR